MSGIVGKPCRYCGTYIYWDENIQNARIKYVEEGSQILHTHHRCAELVRRQGKSLDVFSQEKEE